MDSRTTPSRRTVVAGAGVVALAAVGTAALAACSDGSAATSADATSGNDPAASATPTAGATQTGGETPAGPASAPSKRGATVSAKASAPTAPTTEGSVKPSTKVATSKPAGPKQATPAHGSTTTGAAPAPVPATKPENAIVELTAVPVGGSTIVNGILIGRPSSGRVTGHSTVCTHMGCPLPNTGGSVIECNCHHSRFNAFTGAVEQGPATSDLPSRSVSIVSGWVVG